MRNTALPNNESDSAIPAPESDYLYVAASHIPNAGSGLYTAIMLFKDEVIAQFKGEIIDQDTFKLRTENGADNYFMNLPDGNTLDCGQTDCFAKYANDVVGTNFKLNAYIGMDEHDNVCLFAAKKINPGAEIYCSYGKAYWDKRPLENK